MVGLDPARHGRLVKVLARIARDFLAEQEAAGVLVPPAAARNTTPGLRASRNSAPGPAYAAGAGGATG